MLFCDGKNTDSNVTWFLSCCLFLVCHVSLCPVDIKTSSDDFNIQNSMGLRQQRLRLDLKNHWIRYTMRIFCWLDDFYISLILGYVGIQKEDAAAKGQNARRCHQVDDGWRLTNCLKHDGYNLYKNWNNQPWRVQSCEGENRRWARKSDTQQKVWDPQ